MSRINFKSLESELTRIKDFLGEKPGEGLSLKSINRGMGTLFCIARTADGGGYQETSAWVSGKEMACFIKGYLNGLTLGNVLGQKNMAKITRANMEPFLMPPSVSELQIRYAGYWTDKPQSYWLKRLWEEVSELCLSLDDQHKDPPDRELSQIAAICINWLKHREHDWDLEGIPGDDFVAQETHKLWEGKEALLENKIPQWIEFKNSPDHGLTDDQARKLVLDAHYKQVEAEQKLKECEARLDSIRLINSQNMMTAQDRKDQILALVNELGGVLRNIDRFFLFIERYAGETLLSHFTAIYDFRRRLSLKYIEGNHQVDADTIKAIDIAMNFPGAGVLPTKKDNENGD